MNKKAIAILGAIFLLIVGTLGFLIYSKYSSSKTPATNGINNTATTTPSDNTQGTGNDVATTTTQVPVSNIVKLSEDQVVSPALFYSGKGITYFDKQGGLYQSTLQDDSGQTILTQKKQIDIPVKSGITKILWPAKGDDFIAEMQDSAGNKTWSYFNSKTQVYSDYPAQVESVDWMPTGDKIMYVWLENGKATLNISDPDTKNWNQLADMWELDDKISVSPNGNQVLYYETSSTSSNIAINSVSSDGKVWKTLVKTGMNMGVLWSPDGQKFLFAKKDADSQKYQIWVYNLVSDEVKNLGLFTTTDKAVWDKDSNVIYLSVPTTGTAGSAALTEDTFYRMDTTTMEKKQYPSSSDSPIDGRDLFLNGIGDKLFFRNAQDGSLYYLDLTK
ncbi:MAG: PD40 domain-containing protein [Candidatus Doudnabacteria bacterium]|nr:PD40 domain-containing protein [Candidatus Doudnabacteria bacterium]